MYHLATSPYEARDEITYYSIDSASSHELIKPLINTICNYDSLFKQTCEELSNKVNDVVNKDRLAIQQFTDSLTTVKNKINHIKKESINTKNELTSIRDDLVLSIHSTESQIDQLEGQKVGLQGKKEILEKELSQKQKKINLYKGLSWLIPILAIILESTRAFDSLLEETKTQLDSTHEEIQQLTTDKNHNQKILEESMATLNANQRLTNACDNIQNNINNIQTSLNRIENLSFLKNKLIALENDWSVLMNIVNGFNIDV